MTNELRVSQAIEHFGSLHLDNASSKSTVNLITRFQALARGFLERQKTMIPCHFSSIFQKTLHTVEDLDVRNVSQQTARLWRTHRRGTSDETILDKINMPRGWAIYTRFHNRSLELFFCQEFTCIGQGVYKEYFPATKINIQSAACYTAKFEVLINPLRKDTPLERMLKGIKIQTELNKLFPTSTIMPAPVPFPHDPPGPSQRMTQPWMNRDLLEASNKAEIPLRPNKKIYQTFSFEETMKAIVETADALVLIHSQGYVHRDLKAANILVGDRKSYVSDFDLVSKFGWNDLADHYFAWDSSTREQWLTPFCDHYGLAMSIAMTILKMDYSFGLNPSSITVRPRALLEDIIRQHARSFLKNHLTLKLYEPHLNFDRKSVAEIKKTLVKKALGDFLSQLDENQPDLRDIKRLLRQIVALESCFELVRDVVFLDNQLFKYFNKQPNMMVDGKEKDVIQLLKSKEESDRLLAWEEIVKITGTTQQLRDKIQDIYEALTS